MPSTEHVSGCCYDRIAERNLLVLKGVKHSELWRAQSKNVIVAKEMNQTQGQLNGLSGAFLNAKLTLCLFLCSSLHLRFVFAKPTELGPKARRIFNEVSRYY